MKHIQNKMTKIAYIWLIFLAFPYQSYAQDRLGENSMSTVLYVMKYDPEAVSHLHHIVRRRKLKKIKKNVEYSVEVLSEEQSHDFVHLEYRRQDTLPCAGWLPTHITAEICDRDYHRGLRLYFIRTCTNVIVADVYYERSSLGVKWKHLDKIGHGVRYVFKLDINGEIESWNAVELING
jgi:hypothetical protein